MFTRIFWIDTAERAIRTFAQTFLGVVSGVPVVSAATTLDFGSVGVLLASGAFVGLLAALASVLMALASSRVGDSTSASVVLSTRGVNRS